MCVEVEGGLERREVGIESETKWLACNTKDRLYGDEVQFDVGECRKEWEPRVGHPDLSMLCVNDGRE